LLALGLVVGGRLQFLLLRLLLLLLRS
jgi:hypothetical protein